MSRTERLAMIDRGGAGLSVRRQCALLGLEHAPGSTASRRCQIPKNWR